jgi:hypothetical protein
MLRKSEKETSSQSKKVMLPSRIQTAEGWKRSQVARRRIGSSQKKA